ncbi:helix-turn-helix domain-containing protein [Streptomyces avermitilis]
MRPPQVARRLRVSHKSACAWHARWRDSGVEGLRSKGPSGCPSRMKPEWRAWLSAELEKRPAAHGWMEDQRWTLARVATVIAREKTPPSTEPLPEPTRPKQSLRARMWARLSVRGHPGVGPNDRDSVSERGCACRRPVRRLA